MENLIEQPRSFKHLNLSTVPSIKYLLSMRTLDDGSMPRGMRKNLGISTQEINLGKAKTAHMSDPTSVLDTDLYEGVSKAHKLTYSINRFWERLATVSGHTIPIVGI